MRVHAGGLSRGEAEETIVEELGAITMTLVATSRFALAPSFWGWIIMLMNIPALQRDLGNVIGAGVQRAVPDARLLRTGGSQRDPTDSHTLGRVVRVVHLVDPFVGQLDVDATKLRLLLFQLSHTVVDPILHSLCAGSRIFIPEQRLTSARRAWLLEQEASQKEGLRVGEVFVRHRIASYQDDAAGRRWDLIGYGVLLEWI
mmetsp:Transcript_22142/g.49619  ORF Transcript_22142/g.49619 Transcript_22142/m.49619 type:complete len:201 (+) Transcript_22142:1011-1613(+)